MCGATVILYSDASSQDGTLVAIGEDLRLQFLEVVDNFTRIIRQVHHWIPCSYTYSRRLHILGWQEDNALKNTYHLKKKNIIHSHSSMLKIYCFWHS